MISGPETHMKHLVVLATFFLVVAPVWSEEPPQGLNDTDWRQVQNELKELDARLNALRNTKNGMAAPNADYLADTDIFRKAVIWAFRYENKLEPADVAWIKKAL